MLGMQIRANNDRGEAYLAPTNLHYAYRRSFQIPGGKRSSNGGFAEFARQSPYGDTHLITIDNSGLRNCQLLYAHVE